MHVCGYHSILVDPATITMFSRVNTLCKAIKQPSTYLQLKSKKSSKSK